ncbi:MAG: threonine/serine dehydratase [Schleiferiaceae bacterium]|nr:threonine/serine dehydratase [Schleiferiaceae bacterium]MDR9442464.1 threonine/serine dehydratase [Schleiferiaceae bacterium]
MNEPIQSIRPLQKARATLRPLLPATPVLQSEGLNALLGCEVFFKCENFQKTGSFKARGARFFMAQLPSSVSTVTTHSSGNHGQAVAWAARETGRRALIVMPKNAPAVKVAAVKHYDGEVHFCAPTQAAREALMARLRDQTGATFIPPYDHWDTIAGQSTCAQELLEEVPGLDCLWAPVGGGGLLAGTLLAAKYFSGGMPVYAGEPEGADDAYRSIRSGVRVSEQTPDTLADGLRTTLGERNFEVIRQRVADIIPVSDADTVAAMRLVYERLKIVIEPSCAVPLAALRLARERWTGKRVGILLTGGNVDLSQLPF